MYEYSIVSQFCDPTKGLAWKRFLEQILIPTDDGELGRDYRAADEGAMPPVIVQAIRDYESHNGLSVFIQQRKVTERHTVFDITATDCGPM